MIRFFFTLIIIAAAISLKAQTPDDSNERRIKNIVSFAKICGYIRYFHPSDEAAKINWDRFAVYGIKEVENANSDSSLLKVLQKLFSPIARSVIIYYGDTPAAFEVSNITPTKNKNLKDIYWQHLGLGQKTLSIYTSRRINRPSPQRFYSDDVTFCSVFKSIEVKDYHNKEFMFTAFVKNVNPKNSNGYLWIKHEKDSDASSDNFIEDMNDRPVTSDNWEKYSITGKTDSLHNSINIGAYTDEGGNLLIDNISFSIKDNTGKFEEIYFNGFEKDDASTSPAGLYRGMGTEKWGKEGVSKIDNNDPYEGKQCLRLSMDNNNLTRNYIFQPLFKDKPSYDKPYYGDAGNNIHCIVPMILHGTVSQTYPAADSAAFAAVASEIDKQNAINNNDIYVRLAALSVLYNSIRHFFPYQYALKSDWSDDFTIAIRKTITDTAKKEFRNILRTFMSEIHDGHVIVNDRSESKNDYYLPGFTWEWIEDKLVITKTFGNATMLKAGSIINKINNTDARAYFDSTAQYISASTPGRTQAILNIETLYGKKSSIIQLDVTGPGGINEIISLPKDLKWRQYSDYRLDRTKFKLINPSTWYLNIDQVKNKQIDSLMPELIKAKTIICDLRGYPHDEPDFLSHLLPVNDTCKSWMQVPEIIFPDYNVSGYKSYSWNLKRVKPYIKAKIIFITDAKAISYAESYLGYVQGYKIGTIIGQPTAGTNGNVNTVILPGEYYVRFTGMKVQKQDGSRLFGVGFIPDIVLNKTIKGVSEGRDEFLEKAIELSGR